MSIERSPDSRKAPEGYLYQSRKAAVVNPTPQEGQGESVAAQAVASVDVPATEPSADLDLSFLDVPVQTAEAVNAVSETEPAPEMTDAEAEAFKKQFTKVFGVAPEVAAQQFNELAAYRAQQSAQQQLTAIKQAWGVSDQEAASRLKEVTTRFNQYPKELQEKLDNVEGAQLIWAKLQQERQGQQTNNKTPTLDRSTSAQATSKVGQPQMVKQSDIAKLSPQEYAANADKIAILYARGLVLKGQ